MDDIRDIFKKYIKPNPNPNALSFAMVGLSTLMLVYFVAYKEEPSTTESPSLEKNEEPRSLEDDEQQTTVGGQSAKNIMRHKKNKKTKRRKL